MPVFSGIRSYLEAILVIALLSSLVGTWYYRNSYQRVTAQFELFKVQTATLGEQAKREKDAKEKQWALAVKRLEVQYAEATNTHRRAFDDELTRLQSLRKGDASSSGMSGITTSATICSSRADNDRLLEGIRKYEVGIVQIFKSCQDNTDALMACRAYVKALNWHEPPSNSIGNTPE